MNFETHFIEQVRNGASIVDVVGDHVRLKKAGQNLVGLCPFHNEKTPSFNVSPSKQIYKCFGCNEGGDVFAFIMQVEGLTFPEAVRRLAERVGIAVPQQAGGPSEEALERRRRFLAAMEQAGALFQQWLDAPEGGVARDYLAERGLEAETIASFGLGFAPAGSRLTTELAKGGCSIEELESCGLIKVGDQRRPYDKFRNRVIFPIRDLSGRIIAFGGRAFGDARPKYLNSPDTPLYQKGQNLFGLDLARDPIRKRDFAILVEGYFDCIVPWQYGFQNVIASLGTALTPDQVRLLGRYTRRVIVNFDPDSAGMAAAQRSIDLFLEGGFQINVVKLPAGRDPDTFLREEGAEAYQKLLKDSARYLDFLVDRSQSQHADPFSPRAKQRSVDELLPYLARVPNRIERAEYVSQVARRLQVDARLLMQELSRTARPSESRVRVERQLEATPAERWLLAAVCDPDRRACALAEMDPELVDELRSGAIFKKIFELENQSGDWSVLVLREKLSPEDQDLLDRVLVASTLDGDEVIHRSIDALRRLRDDRQSRRIQQEIESLRSGEENEESLRRLNELLEQKARLRRRRQQADTTPR